MEKDRKLQIIKAAEKRFVKHGLHKTTLEEIARDLRIGKSTIYHYFKSKEDLYFSTLRWQIEQYHLQLKNILFQEKELMERMDEYFRFKDNVFDNFKMTLSMFIQFMNETSFDEETEIIKELYTGESEMLKEVFSKVNFRTEDFNFNMYSFLVHLSWGAVINKRITKTSETLTSQNNTEMLKKIFTSLLK